MMLKRAFLSIAGVALLASFSTNASAQSTKSERNIARCIEFMTKIERDPKMEIKGLEIYSDKFNCQGHSPEQKSPMPLSDSWPFPTERWSFYVRKHKRFDADDGARIFVYYAHGIDRLAQKKEGKFQVRIQFQEGTEFIWQTLPRSRAQIATSDRWWRELSHHRARVKDSKSRNWSWQETVRWMAVGLAHEVVPRDCTPLRSR